MVSVKSSTEISKTAVYFWLVQGKWNLPMSNFKSGVFYIQCDHFKQATIGTMFDYKVKRGSITSI